jgi:hypothetical protein
MLNDQQYSYINWLEQRGLTPLELKEKEEDNFIVKHSKKVAAKVVFIKKYEQDLFSLEEKNLFLKILKALNISPQKVMVIGYSQQQLDLNSLIKIVELHKLNCAVILESDFNKNLFGEWMKDSPLQVPTVSTWSLKDILCDPSLKKSAWGHYQKIIHLLNRLSNKDFMK